MKYEFKKMVNIALSLMLILTFGCVPGSNVNLTQGSKANIFGFSLGVQSQKVSAGKHMTRNAQPYTGPIELKFDTALLGDSYQGPRKVIPWKTASSGGFSTQAVPAGPIVFQEQFVRDKNPIKGEKRDFTVSDTSKVYTLHVQNGDAQGNNTVSSAVISINGQDWVRPNEFKGKGTLEVQKDSILLNANNTMAIDVSGSPGSTMIVTVIEGGQAGTIRRKNGPLNEHPHQAAHNAGNDRTIFDPADPGSLGDLLPSVPGNENTPVPQSAVSVMSMNDNLPEQVVTGQISVHVAQPVQENLQKIIDKYNARVVGDPIEGFYLLQVDMTTINLTHLIDNIRILNTRATREDLAIETAAFGNMESARTFALVAELFTSGLSDGIGFDSILESGATVGPVNTFEDPNLPDTDVYDPHVSLHAQNAWWLNSNSTHINDAWNFSLGYNRNTKKAVRVAVIDGGFAGLYNQMQSNKDLEGQILLDEGRKISFNAQDNENIPWTASELQTEDQEGNDHGTKVIGTIGAQINNGQAIAGIAPQAKLIPIKVGNTSWSEITYALAHIQTISAQSKVDVVNMSIWSGNDGINDFLKRWTIDQGAEGWMVPMQRLVQDLTAQGTVIVSIAGNGGWDAKRNFPAGGELDETTHQKVFPEIITVGAVEDKDPTNAAPPSDLVRAIFARIDVNNIPSDPPMGVGQAEIKGISSYASNWGNTVDIWTPGFNIVSTGFSGGLPADRLAWGGTSAAGPVITGIVALLKAVRPDYSKDQILSLLQTTAYTSQYTDTSLREFPKAKTGFNCDSLKFPNTTCGEAISTQDPRTHLTLKIANAKAALESLLGSDPSAKAQGFQGHLKLQNSQVILEKSASEKFVLSWAGQTAAAYIGRFYAENTLASPAEFLKIADILGQDKFVQVDGWQEGNTIHFVRVRLIPEPPPKIPKKWILKVFNVNDRAEVWINGQRVVNAGFGDAFSTGIDVTDELNPVDNTIRFKVFNDQNNTSAPSIKGDTAWGFALEMDGQVVYRDIRGNALFRSFSNTPPFGARRQDPSLGLVYDQTLTVNKDGSLPGKAPYRLLAYNTSDLNMVRVNINNVVLVIDASNPFSTETMIDSSVLNLNQENDINFQSFTSQFSFPTILNPNNTNNFNSFTWAFEMWKDNTLIYRNRDGERENLDILPSGARFNTSEVCCGVQVLDDHFKPIIQ